jgi:hypothetical protein
MLEMLRGGVQAVPGAVAFAADQLPGSWQQFGAWMIVGSLPGGPAGAGEGRPPPGGRR